MNDDELEAIQGSGKFEFPQNGSTPTGQLGKVFWGSADEAAQFQRHWYRRGETSRIVSTTIGPDVTPMLFPHTDGIGGAIGVDLKDLTEPVFLLK